MLHFIEPTKPAYIDLRDTLEPFDLEENSWAREWSWLSPIHQRGFARFMIVDADVRFSIGRTEVAVTIMDDLASWFEVFFTIEAISDRERKAGVAALGALARAVGIRHIEDAEQLVGRKGAFRVASAEGDVDFMPLGALDE